MTRRNDWIDDDEYPTDRDIEEFGDEDRIDDDPLTIGKVRTRKRIPGGYKQPGYWTRDRVVIAVIAAFLLIAFILGELAMVLGR